MNKKTKVAFALIGFSVATALASCGETVHVHQFVEHDEVFATCAEGGTEAYKTCSECEKYFDLDGNEIAAPVATPIDPNNHKGEKKLAISGDYTSTYEIGDTFDMAKTNFVIKCEFCEGSAMSDSKKAKIAIAYPTEGATCFKSSDVAGEGLKVTFTYGTLTTTADVTVSKKKNDIYGLEPIQEHCGFAPFDTLENVTSAYGTIVYTFSETKDGEYKTKEQLGSGYLFNNDPSTDTPKVYYMKATVAEGEEYVGVEKETTITISHNDTVWNTSREDYDYFGCVCQTPVTFNKKVTTTQNVDLSKETVSISLAETSYNKTTDTIKKITYVADAENSYNLGTNIDALDVSAIKENKALHKDANLEVIVETPKNGIVPVCEHKVIVPVSLLTGSINTVEDLEKYVLPEKNVNKTGYFKLFSNLDVKATVDKLSGKWYNSDVTPKENYFAGTFDGNGKILYSKSGIISGVFAYLKGATIKNLIIEDAWYNGDKNCSIFANKIFETTLDNVTIKITNGSGGLKTGGTGEPKCHAPIAGEGAVGYLASTTFQGNTLKDCTFNCAGWKMGSLFGWNQNMTQPTVTNCKVIAASLEQAMASLYTKKTYQPKGHVTNPENEVELTGLTLEIA